MSIHSQPNQEVTEMLVVKPDGALIKRCNKEGRFHFAMLRYSTRSRFQYPPVSVVDPEDETAEPRVYLTSPPLAILNTWGLRTFMNDHKDCLSAHRFFFTNLYVTDFRFIINKPIFSSLKC